MLYKYISSKRIISKVLTDLDLGEENIRITDLLEWIGESLLKVGSFPQFIIRTTGREDLPVLEISNYQSELPYDFHSLIQVSYSTSASGPFYPMRYATGSYDYNPEVNDVTDTGVEDITSTSNLVTLCMQLYNLSYADALVKVNTEVNTREVLNSLLTSTSTSISDITDSTDYTYTIRGGYIKTNQSTGYLQLSYQAIPTDIEGYPLIPDNESYVEALYWYCVMKLYYPKWVTGTIRDAVYYDARRSWNYYRKQAYGEAMMPDKGQLESIKNTWLRLIPNINEYDTSFSNLGQQEIVYNHATE
ncbi:MAG: hypothetical protein WC346_14670 [Methanogenium sp.]|jgi:hypothetical protein